MLVFKLSWLGFRFMAGICGLINDGDDGSETRVDDSVGEMNGGCIERPFMFRARLGDGEVIGRSWVWFESITESVASPIDMEDSPPKEGPGNAARGARLIGESGDDEGDGSDRDEESVQETVVVGDESADSDAWVDVLS